MQGGLNGAVEGKFGKGHYVFSVLVPKMEWTSKKEREG